MIAGRGIRPERKGDRGTDLTSWLASGELLWFCIYPLLPPLANQRSALHVHTEILKSWPTHNFLFVRICPLSDFCELRLSDTWATHSLGYTSFLLMPLFSSILVPPFAIISVYIQRQRHRPSEHTLEADWITTFRLLRRAFRNSGPERPFFHLGVEDTDSLTRVMAGWIFPQDMFIHHHLSTRSDQLSINLDIVAVLGKGEIWALILAFHGWVMSSSGLSVVSFVKEGRLEQILGATGSAREPVAFCFHCLSPLIVDLHWDFVNISKEFH